MTTATVAAAPSGPVAVVPRRVRAWREHRALLGRWINRLRRQPLTLATTLAQPVVWLLLFGGLLSQMAEGAGVPGGNYLRFMTAGAVVMTIFNAAMNGGVELLFDRETGMLVRMFAAPVHRLSIVTSRFIYVVALSCLQSLFILLVAMGAGVRYETGLLGLAGILLFGALFGAGVASLSVALAFALRDHGDFFAITGFVGLPLMFISSALVPLDLMPAWLQPVAQLNPMTHAIEAVRALVLAGWPVADLLRQVGYLAVFNVCAIALATWVLRRGLR
jgi:ABC-2 type transport system permease protein